MVTLGPETRLGQGDTILLCTDGVWRAFREDQLLAYADKEYLEDGVEEMLDHAQRFFTDKCDNLTALMLRWEDEPTRHKALFDLGTPELDQESLWHSARKNKPRPAAETSYDKKRAQNIDSVIAEIESFINEMDLVNDPARDKTKKS